MHDNWVPATIVGRVLGLRMGARPPDMEVFVNILNKQ